MKYQVREIAERKEIPTFEAGCLDVEKDVRIAWIAYSQHQDAILVTCWDKTDVSLKDPMDKETTATIGKYGEKEA